MLLNGRMAFIIDWLCNTKEGVCDKILMTYEYRRKYYRLPDDDRVLNIIIDNATYLIHETELDEEDINSLPPSGTRWQGASLAALIACIDIMARRIAGDTQESLVEDYHQTDYELHPAIIHLPDDSDPITSVSDAKEYIQDISEERERWLEAITNCLELAQESINVRLTKDKMMKNLRKIVSVLGKIVHPS